MAPVRPPTVQGMQSLAKVLKPKPKRGRGGEAGQDGDKATQKVVPCSVCGRGDAMMQMFGLRRCAGCDADDASDEQEGLSLSQATTLHLASESEMEDDLASESKMEDEQVKMDEQVVMDEPVPCCVFKRTEGNCLRCMQLFETTGEGKGKGSAMAARSRTPTSQRSPSPFPARLERMATLIEAGEQVEVTKPVSYTHLTLPTTPYV